MRWGARRIQVSDFVDGQIGAFLADFFGEGGGEIAFGGGAADGNNALALEFRTFGNLEGGPDVGTGGNAGREPFELGQGLGGGHGVLVAHKNDFINRADVEVFRDKPGTDALNHVRTGLAPGDDRAAGGFHRKGLERAAGLDDFRDCLLYTSDAADE